MQADGRERRPSSSSVSRHAWRTSRLGCRREDVPALAGACLMEVRETHGTGPREIHPDAARLLAAFPWHGGAPEFNAALEDLAYSVNRPVIQIDDVLRVVEIARVTVGGDGETLREATRRFEREFVAGTLNRHGGEIDQAARALGLLPPNLHRKLRALGIKPHRG
jgi:DNA-binding NtrC family response regulator